MLRIFLVSVLFPTIISTNQNQPYLHRTPQPYALSGSPAENRVTHTEQPVIQISQVSTSKTPFEYTFTTKPVPIEPVNLKSENKSAIRMGKIEQESAMSIPVYIIKSFNLNDIKGKEININNILSKVNPNQIRKVQVPVITKEPVNVPISRNKLLFARPEPIYRNRQPWFSKKTEKYPINKYNLPPISPIHEEVQSITMNPVATPINEITLPEDDYNIEILTQPEERVNEASMLTEKPDNKEKLLKEKLVALFMSSKKDLQQQVRDLSSIHDRLKSEPMYKIGYLTNHINKVNKRINKLYTSVKNNHQHWDSLRILEAYEEVIKNNDLIREILKVLHANRRTLRAKKPKKAHKPREMGKKKLVSWEYFDD